MQVGHGARLPRWLLPLVASSLTLLLSACPPPVTPAVATAVSDKMAPTITVSSPAPGQSFEGTVLVTGTIQDDASSTGDNKGILKSIDYTVANDQLRRGRLLVNSDGTTTVDSKFGSGVITWNAAAHTYSFSVSTTAPTILQGQVTITIEATDANDNVQTQIIQMPDGSGPFINISSPTNSFQYTFNATSAIILTGIVHNSSTDTASTNIKSLTWGVDLQPSWGGAITLVPTTTSYSVANGPSPLYSLQPFTFNATTGAFAAKFLVPALSANWVSLQLRVSATDFNNHTNSATVLMGAAGISAPTMLLTGHPSYFTKSADYLTNLANVVTGNIVPSDVPNLGSITFQVTAAGFSPNPIEVYPVDGTTGGSMTLNTLTGDFSFRLLDSGNTTSLAAVTGPATVTVTVTGTNSISASIPFTMQEDDVGPTVGATVASSNATNGLYAKANDTVTLNLTASDALSGLSPTPALTVMGSPATPTTVSPGVYSAPYTVKTTDSGAYQFQVTVKDKAGNPTPLSAVTSGPNITLYGTPPTLSSVSLHSNNSNTVWAKTLDTITVNFTAPRDLAAVPLVTIAGHSASVTPTSPTAHAYTATYQMAGTETEGAVPFSIAFTDAAGDVATPVTSTTDATHVTFDKTPPALTSVAFAPSSGWRKIGDTVTATISAGETGLVAGTSLTVNGKPVTGFTDNGNGTYSVTYTVASGDTDVPLLGSLPVSFILKDPAGNQNAAYTTSAGSGFSPGIDAHVPVISAVSVSPTTGTLKIGSTLTATITTSTDLSGGLTQAGPADVTVNGAQVTGFTDHLNGTYTVTYTVTQGDADQAALNTVPVHVVLTDAAGNQSVAVNPTVNPSPKIDAHAPVISTVTFTPPSGWKRAGQTVTLNINGGEAGLTAGTITVNGVAVTGFATAGGNNYTATYTVGGGDTNWTQAQQIPVSVVVVDAAGNPSAAWTTSPPAGLGIDTTPPAISAVTFTPNSGSRKIGDTIIATISAGETGLIRALAADITINGVNTTAFVDNGDGTYSATYTIVANDTDRGLNAVPVHVVLTDAAGNPSTAWNTTPTNTPSIDAHVPVISAVSVSPTTGTLKIGSTLTATITTSTDLSGGLTQAGPADVTVNGAQVTGFTDHLNGTYTVTYTVTQGDTDHGGLNAVPAHVVLTDAAGNQSVAVNPTVNPSPKIDAHAPVVSTVTFTPPSGWKRAGQTVTLNINGGETGLTAGTITVNGVAVTGFATAGGNNYTATYTVGGGDANWTQVQQVPVSVVVVDAAGNPSAAWTTSPPAGLGIDTTPPAISAVTFTPNSGSRKIGDTIIATITAGETGLTKAAGVDITINGVNTTAFVDNLNGTYSATYTIAANDTDRGLNAVPVHAVLTDAAGNPSTAWNTTPTNTPSIDAHAPAFSSLSVSPTTGTLKIGSTLTVNFATSTDLGGGLTQAAPADITVNGAQATGFTDHLNGTYTVTYTVTQGDTDHTISNQVPAHVVLTDAAGNQGAANPTINPSPKIDAHAPVISNVTFSPSTGWLAATGTLTANITLASSETGLTLGTTTVNGVATTGFAGSGTGPYTTTYTVGGGDTNWPQNGAIPVSIVVVDAAGNPSAAWTTTPAAAPGIDTTPPAISSVTFNTGSTQMTVVFSEGVYKNGNATGSLANASIAGIADQTNGAISGSVSSTTHTAGSTSAVYNVSWTGGTPTANVDQILVTTGTAVFDAAGNQIAPSSTGTGTAKFLRMFGVNLPTARAGVRPTSGIAGIIANLLTDPLDRSLADGSAAILPAGSSTQSTTRSPVSTGSAAGPTASLPERIVDSAIPQNSGTPAPAVAPRGGSERPVTSPALVAAAPQAPLSPPAADSRRDTVVRAAQPQPLASPATAESPVLPGWLVIVLGLLSVSLVAGGAWGALRFLRDRKLP